MKNLIQKVLVLSLLIILSISTFAQMSGNMPVKSDSIKNSKKAVCQILPTQGNVVTGKVTFEQTPVGVKVVVELKGLNPGKHGFHIHECGDCTAADGTSAGGHFNPEMKSHGAPTDAMHHAGDMGNVDADANGNVQLEYVDASISLYGSQSIIGRSIIVHKSEDDMKTQPTGNSGARIACGVIGVSK